MTKEMKDIAAGAAGLLIAGLIVGHRVTEPYRERI
jgi:hypothetical protein